MGVTNSKKAIKLQDIPDKLFSKGILVTEIYKAKLINSKEVSECGVDPHTNVRLSGIMGDTYISRVELRRKYLTSRKRKISLSGWRNNTSYIVLKPNNVAVGVFRVPRKSNYRIIMTNGKEVPYGSFIVVPYSYDKDGNACGFNKNYPMLVNKELFRKMFVIENKESYKKHLREGSNSINRSNNIPVVKDITSSIVEKKESAFMTKQEVTDKKPYRVLGRILRTADDQLIGFVVGEKSSKKVKDCTLPETAKLCKSGLIDNLTIYDMNGKTNFRCIGMTQDSLKIKYL